MQSHSGWLRLRQPFSDHLRSQTKLKQRQFSTNQKQSGLSRRRWVLPEVDVAEYRPDYRHGRIIIAHLLGRNRKREEHPAVIISPDSEIIQPEQFDPRLGEGSVAANEIAVLGVSSHYLNFDDPHKQLPTGPPTYLTKDCAVILNWYAVLDIPDDCKYFVGDVPPHLMREINNIIRQDLRAKLGAMQGTIADLLAQLAPR